MDSKRWLDELPADEREVLEAGLGAGAPAGAKQAVWSAVAGKLPALAAAGAVAGGGASVASLLKVFAVGLGLGSVVVAGAAGYRSVAGTAIPATPVVPSATVHASEAPEPSPRVSAHGEPPAREPPVETRTPPPALPRAGALVAPLPEHPTPARLPQPASVASFPPEPAPAPAGEGAIVAESRGVARARASLRAGDTRAVLTALDALDAAYPRGVLAQEREGLRIEALLSLGETARARELARRFLARYPASPHAPAVERALR